MKLSADQRDMLERLLDGPALADHWDASRSRVPAQLIIGGLIERCNHPTAIDRRWDLPAEAYALTDAGRAMLLELANEYFEDIPAGDGR